MLDTHTMKGSNVNGPLVSCLFLVHLQLVQKLMPSADESAAMQPSADVADANDLVSNPSGNDAATAMEEVVLSTAEPRGAGSNDPSASAQKVAACDVKSSPPAFSEHMQQQIHILLLCI